MKILLATRRRPKVEATRRVLETLAHHFPDTWRSFELSTEAGESGVGDTPVSDEEMRRGARNRARTLAERSAQQGESADLYLGLEGGLHIEETEGKRCGWLRSWAYVFDGEKESWGVGPSLMLPPAILEPVAAGEDLSRVIDRVAGGQDLRSAGGTWGYVTQGLLQRQAAFEAALLTALAPFYNVEVYRSGTCSSI